MATSKDEIKPATAQARLTEDDALRTGYMNGTPLEAGKIADSDPVDLFSQARHVAPPQQPRREDQKEEEEEQQEEETTTAGSRPQERQGMAAPTGGGRRLGRQ